VTLTLATAKITGNPGESGWAQVHEFRPEEEDKLKTRGELFAVIATSKGGKAPGAVQPGGNLDSVVAGRELLGRLHEEYFGKTEKPAFHALKEAVEKVTSEFSSAWGDVQIAAASFIGDVVYSAVGGGAEAAVFRDGMLAKILTSAGQESGVISASGYPKDGDIFLLGTKSFFQILPHGVIKAALEGGSPAEAGEALAPFIHSREDTGNVGVVVMKFERGESYVPKIETEEETSPAQEVSAPIEKKAATPPPTSPASLIRPFFEKVVAWVTGAIGRTLPERRIFVKSPPAELTGVGNRRLAISVGLILLILLVVSIAFGIKQKAANVKKEKYETRLNQAKHDLEEAEKLYSLDAARARELFASARSLISEIESEGVEDQEVAEAKSQIDEKEGLILGIYRVTPELFIDLSILSSGLSGDDLAGSEDRFFVLDREGRKVVGVEFDAKKTEVVAGPDAISSADYLASYENRVFVLGDGISEVGQTPKKVIEKDWEGEALPYSYAGNMYLVDKNAKTIWRYPGTLEGFGDRSKWNTSEINLNFNDLAAVTVDGSIWLITNSGEISRFSLGNKVTFSINGLVPELSSGASIYSNEALKYIYILDRVGSRVVVVDKNGEYKAQYMGDSISEAVDLAVSESTKKIILLAGSKLYSIEIKHLD